MIKSKGSQVLMALILVGISCSVARAQSWACPAFQGFLYNEVPASAFNCLPIEFLDIVTCDMYSAQCPPRWRARDTATLPLLREPDFSADGRHLYRRKRSENPRYSGRTNSHEDME